ncbi:glycosyltransferase family 2 protein [Desulfatirhabdium butyrativorans]|uniref:glycosyltransferase family 2 protein n=1 Tax=Desulfatirhabdium butyrativorans TaxID=340467 RepID=UPI0005516CFE|nr:glycosyltransferase family 2 protein [Desulfatirhabdium butyrativorans]
MMDDIPVSVVIPAYNAEKYIAESIESILGQTFTDFELIVIDDCSTDGTGEIVQRYAMLDKRIRPYRNHENLGIAGNRNRGVELARGKYIAWQDADDISYPTRIEKQYHFMTTHPEIGIVGGYLEIFRNNGKIVGIRKYKVDDKGLRRCIYRYSPVAQPVAMIRRDALKKAGLYDLRYPPAEDLDMTFRIGVYYKLGNIPDVLLKYRENVTSAVFTRLKIDEINTLKIRFKNFANPAYPLSLFDICYNALHFLSVWFIPPKLKIRLFSFFRDSASL